MYVLVFLLFKILPSFFLKVVEVARHDDDRIVIGIAYSIQSHLEVEVSLLVSGMKIGSDNEESNPLAVFSLDLTPYYSETVLNSELKFRIKPCLYHHYHSAFGARFCLKNSVAFRFDFGYFFVSGLGQNQRVKVDLAVKIADLA